MITAFYAVLFGILQGILEFLPVSSSGHLVLFQKIFGVNVDCLLFDIVLHLGTLVAVCIVYYKSIFEIIKHPFCEKAQKLVIATVPTVLVVLLFKNAIKNSFQGDYLFIGFFVTAIIMFIADYSARHNYQYKSLGYGNAMVMGLFQGLAIFPGISRSGSTITAGITQGIRRSESAEFSFLMSIPAILGSLVFELFDIGAGSLNVSFPILLAGFLSSAVSGYLAIKVMLKVIKKAKFVWFGVYLAVLSVVLILNQYIFAWF